MNTKGQLLLVSGLLMSITLIAVSSTITHSVNLGAHQGERHDLTPHISSIESNFPLALEHQIGQDNGSIPISESFDHVSESFESLFALRGISLSFTLTSSTLDSGTYTFVYEYILSDDTITITLSKTTVF
tara:strand:- start:1362 stop:1751 length:390 start_codon:yes stop_codon:yes gene_type:complete